MNPFSKTQTVSPARFPRGSYTVSSAGRIVVSTLPRSSFSIDRMEEIGHTVLKALAAARDLGNPFTELAAEFAGLEIRARNLAGGAIIFVTPQEY
jgi:hypothetical protein